MTGAVLPGAAPRIDRPPGWRSTPHGSINAIRHLLVYGGSLLPIGVIAYLHVWVDPRHVWVAHTFHEAAIGLSIGIAIFVAYVAHQNHRSSGDHFTRWVALAFAGFAVTYAPHGVVTRLADDHMALFLVFGPVSRLVMGLYLLTGLLQLDRSSSPRASGDRLYLLTHAVIPLVLLDIALGIFVRGAVTGMQSALEVSSLAVSLSSLAVLVRRRRSALVATNAIVLLLLAQSSVAFLLSRPWNHMWWLAHVVFALSFFVLFHAVIRAYETTRSFAVSFSERELLAGMHAASAGSQGTTAHVPICAWCRKVRGGDGGWQPVEAYLSSQSLLTFSHGICEGCVREFRSRPGGGRTEPPA